MGPGASLLGSHCPHLSVETSLHLYYPCFIPGLLSLFPNSRFLEVCTGVRVRLISELQFSAWGLLHDRGLAKKRQREGRQGGRAGMGPELRMRERGKVSADCDERSPASGRKKDCQAIRPHVKHTQARSGPSTQEVLGPCY